MNSLPTMAWMWLKVMRLLNFPVSKVPFLQVFIWPSLFNSFLEFFFFIISWNLGQSKVSECNYKICAVNGLNVLKVVGHYRKTICVNISSKGFCIHYPQNFQSSSRAKLIDFNKDLLDSNYSYQ